MFYPKYVLSDTKKIITKTPNSKANSKRGSPQKPTKSNAMLHQPMERMENNRHTPDPAETFSGKKILL